MKSINIICLVSLMLCSLSCQAYAAPNHHVPSFVQVNYDDTTYLSTQIKTEKKEDLLSLNQKTAPYGYDQNIVIPNKTSQIKEYQIDLDPTPSMSIATQEELTQVSYSNTVSSAGGDGAFNSTNISNNTDNNINSTTNSDISEAYDFKQAELYTQMQCFAEICKYTLLPRFLQKASLHVEKMDYSKIIFKVNEPFYFEVENKSTKAKIDKNLLTLDDLNDNEITLVAGKIHTILNIDFTNYTQESYKAKIDRMNDNLLNIFLVMMGILFITGGVYWYLES